MCFKDVVDIRFPRRDGDNMLMGPPIIEIEFGRDILDSHKINGGERIHLRM